VNGIVWPTNAEEQQITLTDTNKRSRHIDGFDAVGVPLTFVAVADNRRCCFQNDKKR
jgi:hypothetical protein